VFGCVFVLLFGALDEQSCPRHSLALQNDVVLTFPLRYPMEYSCNGNLTLP
jgi:hypothetical protein